MAGAVPGRYRAQRKFHAENLRFKEDATLEVMTTFRRPDTLESQVLRAEGSKLIRERVFNKILEAENEIQSKSARGQVDMVVWFDFSGWGRSHFPIADEPMRDAGRKPPAD